MLHANGCIHKLAAVTGTVARQLGSPPTLHAVALAVCKCYGAPSSPATLNSPAAGDGRPPARPACPWVHRHHTRHCAAAGAAGVLCWHHPGVLQGGAGGGSGLLHIRGDEAPAAQPLAGWMSGHMMWGVGVVHLPTGTFSWLGWLAAEAVRCHAWSPGPGATACVTYYIHPVFGIQGACNSFLDA
jgi:hypothetical protein